MEKSIVLYLVVMVFGYIKQSEGAEDADLFMQKSWNVDTLSPGRVNFLLKFSQNLTDFYFNF